MSDTKIPPPTLQGSVCPLPLPHGETIVLGHGSGGRLMHNLIQQVFYGAFQTDPHLAGDDAAAVPAGNGEELVFSTDSHVVWPLTFPGGDIGRLAVCGTVNDIAMLGARPLYLTAAFILEEGLDLEFLGQISASMQDAAQEAGVRILAGDTKVVEKGKADGLYITTAGVGMRPSTRRIGGRMARPGDAILVSGPLGDHGIAVLSARGDLGLEVAVESDVAPLNHLVAAILEASDKVHVLRDPTRGGLATSLNEIARQSQVGMVLEEPHLPIRPAVAAACEVLGFDPLYVANEGKLIAIVAGEAAEPVLEAMRQLPLGREAALIGQVVASHPERVLMKTPYGTTRVVDTLMGELLPRIC